VAVMLVSSSSSYVVMVSLKCTTEGPLHLVKRFCQSKKIDSVAWLDAENGNTSTANAVVSSTAGIVAATNFVNTDDYDDDDDDEIPRWLKSSHLYLVFTMRFFNVDG